MPEPDTVALDVVYSITEREFQRQIEELLEVFGWLYYHTYDSRRSNPGFPDLVAVKGKRLLFIELKSDKGRLTPGQKMWKWALIDAGQEWHEWRPRNWEDIVKTLEPREG